MPIKVQFDIKAKKACHEERIQTIACFAMEVAHQAKENPDDNEAGTAGMDLLSACIYLLHHYGSGTQAQNKAFMLEQVEKMFDGVTEMMRPIKAPHEAARESHEKGMLEEAREAGKLH